jgi:hypothetical protein
VTAPPPATPPTRYAGPRSSTLADVLERVLDRGVVIAGDIVVQILDRELLTLKVRLLIASVDTAQRMGIDWWTTDPFLNAQAASIERENHELRSRIEDLERRLAELGPADSASDRAAVADS